MNLLMQGRPPVRARARRRAETALGDHRAFGRRHVAANFEDRFIGLAHVPLMQIVNRFLVGGRCSRPGINGPLSPSALEGAGSSLGADHPLFGPRSAPRARSFVGPRRCCQAARARS